MWRVRNFLILGVELQMVHLRTFAVGWMVAGLVPLLWWVDADPWTLLAVPAAGMGGWVGRRWSARADGRALGTTAPRQVPAALLLDAEAAERRRIAGVLHDDLQPQLAAVRLLLLDPAGTARADAALADALATTRSLAHALLPSDDPGTLIDALGALVGHFRRWHRLDVVLDADPRVAATVRDPVWRGVVSSAVRELLFNASRHAAQASVRVSVTEGEAWIFVAVADNGPGMPVDRSAGAGLPGVEARAEAIGGHVDLWSVPGEGLRVTLALPRPTAASGAAPPTPAVESGEHRPSTDRHGGGGAPASPDRR